LKALIKIARDYIHPVVTLNYISLSPFVFFNQVEMR